jgi:hypothetical protein
MELVNKNWLVPIILSNLFTSNKHSFYIVNTWTVQLKRRMWITVKKKFILVTEYKIIFLSLLK